MLDTNICTYMMKRQPAVAARFAQCRQGEVVISSITLAELEYGASKGDKATQQQSRQALSSLVKTIPAIPFDQSAAKAYALVRASAPGRNRYLLSITADPP